MDRRIDVGVDPDRGYVCLRVEDRIADLPPDSARQLAQLLTAGADLLAGIPAARTGGGLGAHEPASEG